MNKIIHDVRKGKSFIIASVLILLFLAMASVAMAEPMPLGIDGHVYDIDGVTLAGDDVHVSVLDIENGYYREGMTRDARYSFSIYGDAGDRLLIRAWTEYDEVNATFIAGGVLHDADIFIDLSMPELPPIFSSPYNLECYEDESCIFTPLFSDPNDDIIHITVDSMPPGMIYFDGRFTWLPDDQDIGMHYLNISASDKIYDVPVTIKIEVIGVNDAPVILSMPITETVSGQEYRYELIATDPDSDNLSFSILDFPDGMMLTEGNVLEWIPGLGQTGEFNISIMVDDGAAGNIQEFTLYVRAPDNTAPVILTQELLDAYQGNVFSATIDAYDPEGDEVFLSLESNISTMYLSGERNDILTWLPGEEDIGTHIVIIRASDDKGASTTKSFYLDVIAVDDPPIFTSIPVTEAYHHGMYSYDADAYDPEGEEIVFGLLESPRGMIISETTGMISWVPKTPLPATILIYATDGNNTAFQRFDIEVFKRKGNYFSGRPEFRDGRYILQSDNLDSVIQSLMSVSDMCGKEIFAGNQDNMPEGIGVPPVYDVFTYITISVVDGMGCGLDADAGFKISSEWLEEIEDLSDVYLFYYDSGQERWEKSSELIIERTEDGYIGLARGISQGIYAIGADDDKENLQKKAISRSNKKKRPAVSDETSVLMGKIIFSDGIPAQDDIDYEIRNTRTGNITAGKIYGGFNGFSEVISGQEGDELEITVGNGEVREKVFSRITGDVVREDIVVGMRSQDYRKKLFISRIEGVFSNLGIIALVLLPWLFIFRIGYIHFRRRRR